MKNRDCRLLIISHIQFGYHTGTFKYCEHLRSDMSVSYLGFDFNHRKRFLDKVSVLYVKRSKGIIVNYVKFINEACRAIIKFKPDYIFMPYFFGASLINLYFIFSKFRRRMVLDIRTSFIFSSERKTKLANTILKFESIIFNNITVISEGLKKFLNLPTRTFVLPLGGESVISKPKIFDSLNFLYVGTFYDRNLIINLSAFADFYNTLDESQKAKIRYYIIGYGPIEDVNVINNFIVDNNLSEVVRYKGEVRYPELDFYMEKCNVGISYIPLKPYYDMQPPTKTFEYLVNGMLVLATATSENKKVITNENGVCAPDDYHSQLKAFHQIYEKSHNLNGEEMASSAQQYTWHFIINNILKTYLNRIRE